MDRKTAEVTVYLTEIHVPKDLITTPAEAEGWIRKIYKGIQVRTCGLGCREFPHPKRIPYVSLALDGAGWVVGATMYSLD